MRESKANYSNSRFHCLSRKVVGATEKTTIESREPSAQYDKKNLQIHLSKSTWNAFSIQQKSAKFAH